MAAITKPLVNVFSRSIRASRSIVTTTVLRKTIEDLEKAKIRVTQLKEDPGNVKKLELYSFYKQATVGSCDTKRPGMMDIVGRAKWDAWNKLGNMSQTEAIDKYCDLVDGLVGQQSSDVTDSNVTSSSGDLPAVAKGDILVTKENGIQTITLNRPAKKNAITIEMYQDMIALLQSSGADPSVRVTVITGCGDYYCSGNDLSNFLNIPPEGPEHLAQQSSILLRNFVSAFINYPKVLIAAVNGPAVGISVTILALFDLVYATDNATFHTPFMQLGQSPEGCSSFLFPRFMGAAKANEILLLGRKITADEAYERNLVTRVFPVSTFEGEVKKIASEVSALPPNSLLKSKALIHDSFTSLLEVANKKECELLAERWLSEECMQAIIAFMQKRNN